MKIRDIRYVVYQVTDLEKTRAFVSDFGLTRVDAPGPTTYFRGVSSSPFIYAAEQAAVPRLKAIGIEVETAADLELATSIEGASAIHPLDRPGDGLCVDIMMPGGFKLELLHGVAHSPELPTRPPLAINEARRKTRINSPQRLPREPAHAIRLGHVVLAVTDAIATRDWLVKNLGMIVSDSLLVPGSKDEYVGFFMRFDRGATPSDHHSLLITQGERNGVHHISFEMEDMDAVYMGHEWMKQQGYEHHWGVGRHVLGSQVFDYWWDPDGFRLEHYADGDLFDNTVEASTVEATNDQLWIWGPEVPETFFKDTSRS